MRLDEITDEDKTFLILKQIRFDFQNDYINAVDASTIIGKSMFRRNLLKGDIDLILNDISIFLREGFLKTDPDVIAAKDIFKKLKLLKKSL